MHKEILTRPIWVGGDPLRGWGRIRLSWFPSVPDLRWIMCCPFAAASLARRMKYSPSFAVLPTQMLARAFSGELFAALHMCSWTFLLLSILLSSRLLVLTPASYSVCNVSQGKKLVCEGPGQREAGAAGPHFHLCFLSKEAMGGFRVRITESIDGDASCLLIVRTHSTHSPWMVSLLVVLFPATSL